MKTKEDFIYDFIMHNATGTSGFRNPESVMKFANDFWNAYETDIKEQRIKELAGIEHRDEEELF